MVVSAVATAFEQLARRLDRFAQSRECFDPFTDAYHVIVETPADRVCKFAAGRGMTLDLEELLDLFEAQAQNSELAYEAQLFELALGK